MYVIDKDEDLYDLTQKDAVYPQAFPVLLEYLKKRHTFDWEKRVHSILIDAVAVKEARGVAGKELVCQFRKEKDEGLRFEIGNALSVVATEEEVDDLTTLALDGSYGGSRAMLCKALARVLGDDAVPILAKLLKSEDQAVVGMTIQALGDRRAVNTRESIESFLNHKESWVRGEARKAIKKMDTHLKRIQKKLEKELKDQK